MRTSAATKNYPKPEPCKGKTLQNHNHVHGPNCGHAALPHNDHIDYLHDGHYHHNHEDHTDECTGPTPKKK